MGNAVGLEGGRDPEGEGQAALHIQQLTLILYPSSVWSMMYWAMPSAWKEGGTLRESGQAPLHMQQLTLIMPMSQLTLILYPSSVLSMM